MSGHTSGWARQRNPAIRQMLAAAGLMIMTACSESDGGRDDVAAVDSASADARVDTVMQPLAEQYVKLVLAVGAQSEGYVDAYYGPAEWQEQVTAEKAPLDSIAARTTALAGQVSAVDVTGASQVVQLRKSYLSTQLGAVSAYVRMLQGEKLSFDEESRALYGVVAPTHDEAHFRMLVDSLNAILPGTGPVPARLERYKRDFVIPPARLDTVFKTAIAEARRRTAANVELPPNESFVLEYVTDKSWSGYNWYKGNANSLIQINTDLPIFIDRAVDLGAHEGYPGHHVYNVLLEHHLVRGRNWPEYSVYPLFSPQSLIAEGSANYGIDVAFPGAERLKFERDVLFPLAGLDSSRAAEYERVRSYVDKLSYAGNEAARAYLDGKISADSAAKWINAYALMEPARAQQRVKFIDTYRSYVINYNYGRDMVGEWVTRSGGTAENPARRWESFKQLLSTPRLPGDLK